MIQLGLDRCLRQLPTSMERARLGLLMNQASVDGDFRYACDRLAARCPGQLRALFSPQHGMWSEQQANMIESPHGWYAPLQLPIYSLYSDTRQPTAAMLQEIDCLVVDLQDVGTRVYTFLWTLSHCLEACAVRGIPVVVLDRPNPLGGETIEGPLLEREYISFVGRDSIPMRHGLTLGELARLLCREWSLDVQLEIVPLQGWRRSMLFAETGRHWVLPSPNMPRLATTQLYPGQVLLEGTNLSEGRGTTLPFELVGAPFIDPERLARELQRQEHPGLTFRPVRFVPTFDKWHGQSCGGVALHIVDPRAVRSFRATVGLLGAVRGLWPEQLQWLPPPYEYEREKIPIDLLYGSPVLRETLAAVPPGGRNRLEKLTTVDADAWWSRVEPVLLYD